MKLPSSPQAELPPLDRGESSIPVFGHSYREGRRGMFKGRQPGLKYGDEQELSLYGEV